jgi:hypothetical protein
MSTKIQINSLEALERLIGGDTELEIEIRNSVAQNFAEKYLKALVNGESSQIVLAVNDIKREANATFKEVATREIANAKTEWGRTTYTIQPSVVEDMKSRVRDSVRDIVRELVKEEMEKQKDLLEGYVSKSMTVNIQDTVNKMVRQKLESVLK